MTQDKNYCSAWDSETQLKNFNSCHCHIKCTIEFYLNYYTEVMASHYSTHPLVELTMTEIALSSSSRHGLAKYLQRVYSIIITVGRVAC